MPLIALCVVCLVSAYVFHAASPAFIYLFIYFCADFLHFSGVCSIFFLSHFPFFCIIFFLCAVSSSSHVINLVVAILNFLFFFHHFLACHLCYCSLYIFFTSIHRSATSNMFCTEFFHLYPLYNWRGNRSHECIPSRNKFINQSVKLSYGSARLNVTKKVRRGNMIAFIFLRFTNTVHVNFPSVFISAYLKIYNFLLSPYLSILFFFPLLKAVT